MENIIYKIYDNFFQIPVQSKTASLTLLILRLIAGFAFIIHGSQKLQNPYSWMGPESAIPGFFQLLATLSEFGGGTLWILGFLTPLASLGIGATMAVAVFTTIMSKYPFVDLSGGISFELPLVYLGIALVIFVLGPGKISLDKIIFKERKKN